ncbi:hypothetical protein B5S28_g1430 [[Candida] boidinii]|nr:hypothetical protein B5S28_g1430 [[Candida] boidinii]OWB59568.1 hypothetical protein B5S29_g427 [[Candida] boidinii]OWB70622.1 hypothetical protein B5S31_g301 [[Candida] boidinii]OWB78521.1 hypothetical protein B5S32_g2717 [[Candida] boidinii]GMF39049.1 unnamed protein product [[Candida] boidinii]
MDDGTGLSASLEQFEKLKNEMTSFQQIFNSHLTALQNELTSRKIQFDKTLSELKDHERDLKTTIRKNQELEKRLISLKNDEIDKYDESKVKIEELRNQQDDLLKQKIKFESQINQIENQITKSNKELQERKNFIQDQSSINDMNIYLYEKNLGLKILSIDNEAIRFVFNNIDPDDYLREVWFELDAANWNIISTKPALDPEITKKILNDYFKHKEIGYFWRNMRSELKKKLLSK